MSRSRALIPAAVVALLTTVTAATPANAAEVELVGTFRIAPGSCAGGGSLFRMILPTGTTGGPFVSNQDSACADKTITTLTPGTDGGLVAGTYQPAAAFDADGNSGSTRITRPTPFFGVQFGLSTNATDPQSGQAVPPPTIRVDRGSVSGDLSAFAASWNRQEFNQGAPKPGGTRPGLTSGPTGTYDAATGQLAITWTSQIVGGPFNNFTGQWQLAGTFVPAGAGPASVAAKPAPKASGATSGAPASTPLHAPPGPATDAATTTTVALPAPEGPSTAPEPPPPAPVTELAASPVTRSTTPVPLWLGVVLVVLGIVLASGGAAFGWTSRRRSDGGPA